MLESFRVQAGESGLLPALIPFLHSSEVSTRLQVLRAIGNLCIDNGNYTFECIVLYVGPSAL